MIYYQRAYLCAMLSGCAPIKAAFSQRIVWAALAVALPMGAISAALKIVDDQYHLLQNLVPETLVYGTLTSIVGFMLVFRTSQSYNRFAEGCSLMHVMQADFLDAGALLISMSRASKADSASLYEFRRIVVRLISILNALCLSNLGKFELMGISSLAHFVIDFDGLDAATIQLLEGSGCKPAAACQLLQNLVCDSLDTVLKGVPAPLLTRVYQELGGGMIRFHEAHKLPMVPFPFPFATVSEMILIGHTMLTPFQMAMVAQGPLGAFTFTMGFAFFAWSLYALALELDDPFGKDMNDLDLHGMQHTLNAHLLHLLVNSTAKTPGLSQNVIDEHKLIESRWSFRTEETECGSECLSFSNSVLITRNNLLKARTNDSLKSRVPSKPSESSAASPAESDRKMSEASWRPIGQDGQLESVISDMTSEIAEEFEPSYGAAEVFVTRSKHPKPLPVDRGSIDSNWDAAFRSTAQSLQSNAVSSQEHSHENCFLSRLWNSRVVATPSTSQHPYPC